MGGGWLREVAEEVSYHTVSPLPVNEEKGMVRGRSWISADSTVGLPPGAL